MSGKIVGFVVMGLASIAIIAYQILMNKKERAILDPNENDTNPQAKNSEEFQYICPITQNIIEDPVKSIYGHYYEKKAI